MGWWCGGRFVMSPRIASYFVSLYLTSRLQMAQVCADWNTKDRPGCRMENAGLDAWETSNNRL